MKNVGIVADHQVEATIGIGINGAEGFRRPCRICMIQGFEDELAADASILSAPVAAADIGSTQLLSEDSSSGEKSVSL